MPLISLVSLFIGITYPVGHTKGIAYDYSCTMPFIEFYIEPLTGAAGAASARRLQICLYGKSLTHGGSRIIHADGTDLFEQFFVHDKPYAILVKNLITFT
jgi:hypothetical protein